MLMRTTLSALLAVFILGTAAPPAEVRGVIEKIDPDKKELVLDGRGLGVRGRSFTFVIGPETHVQFGGRPAQLSDLPLGKRARVTYESRNGQLVATSISVISLFPPPVPAARAVPAAPIGNAADTVTGELRRVAITEREIAVIGPGAVETPLPVADNVSVHKHGKPAAYDDLREGEQAVVRFEQQGGRRVATAIHVGDAAVSAPEESRLQKVRRVLKLVDTLLDLADKSKMFDR